MVCRLLSFLNFIKYLSIFIRVFVARPMRRPVTDAQYRHRPSRASRNFGIRPKGGTVRKHYAGCRRDNYGDARVHPEGVLPSLLTLIFSYRFPRQGSREIHESFNDWDKFKSDIMQI